MRADRLVSILMLLQSQGRMSARELADELDVSVRTIYRDVDALCAAGIPLYAEHGVSGGYALMEQYRSGLTGLTDAERRALILFKLPEPLDALDIGQNLNAARRKLAAVLPNTPNTPRIYLDWKDWAAPAIAAGQLEILYHAIHENRQVHLVYLAPNLLPVDQIVCPLGLVAKAGTWQLVCLSSGKVHCHTFAELIQVEPSGETFDYPQGFHLQAYWETYCTDAEADLFRFSILVRARPEVLPILRRQPGARELPDGESDPEGWRRMELRFDGLEAARGFLLGFGRAVEALAPIELRISIADYAHQIGELYSEGEIKGLG